MRFSINKKILDKYPNLSVGVIVCKGIDNSGKDKEIDSLLGEVENLIKQNFVPAQIAHHSLISPWRAAYSDFGSKPSKYTCSVETLMRKILKGKGVPRKNKLINLKNYFSMKYIVPLGSYDLDKIKGDIKLTLAEGKELFVSLGAKKSEHPKKGEVIYLDEKEVLCRNWNWKNSKNTITREKTKNAIIYVEGLFPVTKEKVESLIKEFISLAKVSLKGKYSYFILDKRKPQVEF